MVVMLVVVMVVSSVDWMGHALVDYLGVHWVDEMVVSSEFVLVDMMVVLEVVSLVVVLDIVLVDVLVHVWVVSWVVEKVVLMDA